MNALPGRANPRASRPRAVSRAPVGAAGPLPLLTAAAGVRAEEAERILQAEPMADVEIFEELEPTEILLEDHEEHDHGRQDDDDDDGDDDDDMGA